MIRNFLFVLSALCCLGLAAPAPHLLSFKQYKEALDAGDEETAAIHAERAWQQSIDDGADLQARALLAQNFLDLVILSDPERAAPAVEDALTLGEQGYGVENYGVEEVRLFSAYIALKAEPKKRKSRETLIDALEGMQAADLNDTALSISILIQSIDIFMSAEDMKKLRVLTGYLDRSLSKNPSVSVKTLSYVRSIRVLSILSIRRKSTANPSNPNKRFVGDLNDSAVLIENTLPLFEPVQSIDDVDPMHATIVTLNGIVESFAGSYSIELNPNHVFENMSRIITETTSLNDIIISGRPDHCDIEWRQDRVADFPERQYGGNGSILIGYHLNQDGDVYGERVLAQIPKKLFTDSALSDVSKWKAEPSSIDDEACRKNLIARLTYSSSP